MTKPFSELTLMLVAALTTPAPAATLTMQQFSDICGSGEVECSDHPLLRAYVGGALDAIAVLLVVQYLEEAGECK